MRCVPRLLSLVALSLVVACQGPRTPNKSEFEVIRQSDFNCPKGTTFEAYDMSTAHTVETVNAGCEGRNGKRHGPYRIWHGRDVILRGNYKEGERAGTWTSYHRNGEKRWRARFRDGELDGDFEAWSSDGNRRIRGSYSDGKLDGSYRRWFSNGNIAIKGTFDGGERIDAWEVYERSGYLWVRSFPDSNREREWSDRAPRPQDDQAGGVCTKEDLARRIKALTPRLRSCAGWSTPQNTDFPVNVRVRFSFYQNGHIGAIRLLESSQPHTEINACVQLQLQTLRPVLPERGGICAINKPFIFERRE